MSTVQSTACKGREKFQQLLDNVLSVVEIKAWWCQGDLWIGPWHHILEVPGEKEHLLALLVEGAGKRLLQGLFNIAGNVNCTIVVVPINRQASLQRGLPVFCDDILGLKCI
jgi:hypothetical protein